MSDDDEDDDTPFFARRAAFFPKVSAEEFQSVSKLIFENDSNGLKFPNKGKASAKTAKTGSGLKRLVPESEKSVDLSDSEEKSRESIRGTEEPVLSASAKRRLKKIRDKRENELKLIKTLNRQVLKEADYTPKLHEIQDIDDDKPERFHAILTVSYMCKVSRIRCYDDEKFSTILPRIADLFKLKASELLLCLPDRNINLDDTPKSLNLTLNDIIDCIPYKGSENAKEDEDRLKLIFQSNDSKNKIDLLVHKLEKMQEVMKRYSKKKGVPLSMLTFEFDGEKIEGMETPVDLDMETGNCIDVKVVVIETPAEKVLPVKEDSIASCTEVDDACPADASPADADIINIRQQSTSPRNRGRRGRGRCKGRGRGRRGRGRGRATTTRNDDTTTATPLVFTVDSDSSDIMISD